MAATVLATISQNLKITEITDIVVSTIAQDPSGDYVRTVQIWGTPENATEESSSMLVLALELHSLDSGTLKLVSPQSEF
jgi:hypothetical protein